MDAAVGEVLGEVLGLGLAPFQEKGRGVVEGIEGGGVLLLPAQFTQGAAPAHPLRRPVKDHRRVLLRGRGGAVHAVVQFPQSVRRVAQPLPQGLFLGGFRHFLPPHPLPAEHPAGDSQKQHRPRRRFPQQAPGQFLPGGQHGRQRPQEKGPSRERAASTLGRQQRRRAVGGGEQTAGPGGKVRHQAQAQPGGDAGEGPLVIGGVGQQGAQQRPAYGDVQDRQVPQGQGQRRPQKQQSLRGQAALRPLEQLAEKVSGHPAEHCRRHTGGQLLHGGEGLNHINAPHCQHHSRRQGRQHPGPLPEFRVPEGGGGRQHQDAHRRKGQHLGKFQKQQCPRHAPQQGGGPIGSRPCRRDAAQGKGGVAPGGLAGGQRRRKEKADAPVQPPA